MVTHKLKWIAGLLIILLLIIATILLDRMEYRAIKQSVTAIYEDRLVAQNIILNMNLLLSEKSTALASSADATFFNSKNDEHNQQMLQLVTDFEKTKLTKEEAANFASFKAELQNLLTSEAVYSAANSTTVSAETRGKLAGLIATLKRELYALSKIQMKEGKREMQNATSSTNTVTAISSLQMVLLVIIGLILQAIIIYRPKKITGPSLN